MNIESEIKMINEHVAKGNFHAAINIAISAVNECRRNNNQAGVDKFLDICKEIIHTMTQAFGSHQS